MAEPTVVIQGTRDPRLETRIRAKIVEVLARVTSRWTAAKVVFADENGPKGGPGTRCTIVLEMPRRRGLSVSEMAAGPEIAFAAAFAPLSKTLIRDRDRRRELARRPKKYYLAKRLLAPDTVIEPAEPRPETVRRPKRARRRSA